MFGQFSNTVEPWACFRFLNRRDPFHVVGGSRQREALLLGRLSTRDPEVRLRDGPELHRHKIRLQLRRRPQPMVSDARRSSGNPPKQLNSRDSFRRIKINNLMLSDCINSHLKWFPWINLVWVCSYKTHYLQELNLGIPVSDSAHQPFQKNDTSRWIFCLN